MNNSNPRSDMEAYNFIEIKEFFELQLKANLKFELLELKYAPYAFGSGMSAYRINGRNFRIVYDGKDNWIQLMTSAKHSKYDNAEWKTIFAGTPMDFLKNDIVKLMDQ